MAEGAPPSIEQGMILNARPQEIVPALLDLLKTKASYTAGSVGNHNLDVLLDSGASCSMICKDYVLKPLTSMKLANADGSDLAPVGTLMMISVDGPPFYCCGVPLSSCRSRV